MDDFTLTLRASIIWRLFLFFYYLAAAVYILCQPFYAVTTAVLLLVVSGLAVIEFRRCNLQQKSPLKIKLHDQQWFVAAGIDPVWEPVAVQRYFNSPWLLVLYCMPSAGGKNCYYCCWRDALSASNWRALKSRLAIYN